MSSPSANVTLYEGLFLMSQAAMGSDFEGTVDHLRQILLRAEAEIVLLEKWEERKLAYEIEGQKRGTFLLAIFRARGTQIPNIERDCNLSEMVLRSMIIRGDHLGEPELELAKRGARLATEAKLRARSPEEGGDADEDGGPADDAESPETADVETAE